ncbi:MAG TPA: NAD-dependent epimerase/dehydratase family protein [Pirellulaceae bacterium]|jgi:nucleoside-diphosphate-sugar epimerase|nr:NAD-dependent epimerase/dehydratase family protein [Pirellulaceae bacterium]
MRIFLTGATGFLGGYVAEACVEQGFQVRALVQPGWDTTALSALDVEMHEGDLRDRESLQEGLQECDLILHTAAKVGDWGQWNEFYEANVEGAKNLYDAAVAVGVPRAVHISSTAVYGKELILHGAVDETMGPLKLDEMPTWYSYGRSKLLGELLAMEYHQQGKLLISVIRPGWVYGPRDHARLGKLMTMIKCGQARIIGDGTNELMLTYVTNVAEAVLLAGTHAAAPGEAFNVSNDGDISQRKYFDALSDQVGAERVRKTVPFKNAYCIALALETSYRLLRIKRPPMITRQSVSLVGLSHRFRTEKISTTLGWQPKVDFDTAIEKIGAWWHEFESR